MSRIRTIALSAAVLLLGVSPSFGANDLSPAERIWYAQGLTHPMVVHIPIALFLAGAIAAILRVVFRRIPISIVYYCLLIGALGAIPSVLAGWAWAPQKQTAYMDLTDLKSGIFWHRWVGVVMTVWALITLVWATVQLRKKARYVERIPVTNSAGDQVAEVKQTTTVEPTVGPSQFGWQFCVVLLAGGMSWVAHDGGELAYPGNFQNIMQLASGEQTPKHLRKKVEKTVVTEKVSVTEPATTQQATPSTQGTAVAPTTKEGAPATTAVMPSAGGKVDFAKQVWPIFVEKCIYCHGPKTKKGKLAMHTEELSLKGGTDDGPLYIVGRGAESPLIVRAHSDDEDVIMPPPKEDKKLTDAEIKILTQWVDEGAVWAPVPPLPDQE